MAEHVFKRTRADGTTQTVSMPSLTPPPGKGWVLASKFGLTTKGGASPSRAS